MKNHIILLTFLAFFSISSTNSFAQGGSHTFTVGTNDLINYPCLSGLSLEADQTLYPLAGLTPGSSITVGDMNSISLYDPSRFVAGNAPFTHSHVGSLILETWTICFQECCDDEYLDVCVTFSVNRNGNHKLDIIVTNYGDCF